MPPKKKSRRDSSGNIAEKQVQDPIIATDQRTPQARGARLPNPVAEPAKERRVSPRFLKRMGLTAEELKERRKHWLAKPDSYEKRNAMCWEAAKKQAYAAAYDQAQERQKELGSSEWMVACLLSEGVDREQIAAEMAIQVDTVDKLIRVVKEIACVETPAHIARWFFGL
jgi:FixJ family two-component response regulator